MFIGITGGIGSGKTYICEQFKAMGVPVYNSDERAKYIMNNDADLIASLISSFGTEIYKNGKLQRKVLAKKVFNDKEALALLNSIVHPAVEKDVLEWKNNHPNQKYLLKEAALLFETGSYKNLDKTIKAINKIKAKVIAILKNAKSLKLMSYHKEFSYFIKDFG